MLFTPFMWSSPASAMPCLLSASHRPSSPWISLGESAFLGSLRRPSQAGRFHVKNAVLRPSTTPTLKPRDGFVRPARRRRENRVFRAGLPFTLRRATYVAFTKVTFFRISLVFRITLNNFSWSSLFALLIRRVSRAAADSAASPRFRLGLASVAKSCYSKH
jgi:hypothetical protein